MTSPGVLLVGNHLSSSGRNVSVGEELAKRLESHGWHVILTSRKPNRIARLADMLFGIYASRHMYQAAQVDVFSGTGFLWAEVAGCCLSFVRKPFVLTLHGGDLPAFSRRWPGRVRRLLHSANAVTTPSQFLLRVMNAYRADIGYLPNGLDLCAYTYRLRKQPRPRLVWLRALHRIYNPTDAVEAMALLAPEFPDLRLAMVGPDKGDGSLGKVRTAAAAQGIAGCVDLIGPVAKHDVPKYLDGSDIFLNTTRYESFGVSVMEAAACGLCIVTSNVGELPYLWEDGRDALLVPPNDPPAMAAAVRRILTEPGLAEHLSTNARRKAEQFDWSVILPQWEELFRRVGAGA